MGTDNGSILIVDDDVTVVRILRSILADVGSLRFATSGQDALKFARKAVPDLMLLDVEMPGLSGFDVCKAFKSDPVLLAVPIIFVTSHQSTELETTGLKLGAADFITKPLHAELVLARVRAQLDVKRLSDTLRSAVTLDFMTGLSNRLHLEKILQQECQRAQRSGAPVTLLLLEVGESGTQQADWDEEAGQEVLRDVAAILRSEVRRPADLLARYAERTFAALLPETDAEGAAAIARRAWQAIRALNLKSSTPFTQPITLSAGIGCTITRLDAHHATSAHTVTKEVLIGAAQKALVAAKSSSARGVVIIDVDGARSSSAVLGQSASG